MFGKSGTSYNENNDRFFERTRTRKNENADLDTLHGVLPKHRQFQHRQTKRIQRTNIFCSQVTNCGKDKIK